MSALSYHKDATTFHPIPHKSPLILWAISDDLVCSFGWRLLTGTDEWNLSLRVASWRHKSSSGNVTTILPFTVVWTTNLNLILGCTDESCSPLGVSAATGSQILRLRTSCPVPTHSHWYVFNKWFRSMGVVVLMDIPLRCCNLQHQEIQATKNEFSWAFMESLECDTKAKKAVSVCCRFGLWGPSLMNCQYCLMEV